MSTMQLCKCNYVIPVYICQMYICLTVHVLCTLIFYCNWLRLSTGLIKAYLLTYPSETNHVFYSSVFSFKYCFSNSVHLAYRCNVKLSFTAEHSQSVVSQFKVTMYSFRDWFWIYTIYPVLSTFVSFTGTDVWLGYEWVVIQVSKMPPKFTKHNIPPGASAAN